jgi:hypothetical protein
LAHRQSDLDGEQVAFVAVAALKGQLARDGQAAEYGGASGPSGAAVNQYRKFAQSGTLDPRQGRSTGRSTGALDRALGPRALGRMGRSCTPLPSSRDQHRQIMYGALGDISGMCACDY